MKFLIPILCIFSVAAQAQYGSFTPEQEPGFGTSPYEMPSQVPSATLGLPADEEIPDVEQLSHSGLSARGRNPLTASGVVSPVWAGSISTMDFNESGMRSMQVRSGYLAMTQAPSSNLQGNGIFASLIPVYVGVRQNLAVTTTSNMEWTQYAVAGGGPLIGIAHPESASFLQSFSRMSFRWGAGAYAGLGSEMRFDHGLGLYAQLELTGFGFTAPLMDTQSYIGPSISFGILFFPQ